MSDAVETPTRVMLFWGKLLPQREGAQSFHPLLCHMLDVAAVAHALWRQALSPAACWSLAAGLKLPEEAAARWVAFLAGLHDLGKACPVFQLRREAQALAAFYHDLPGPPPGATAPHGHVTTRTLPSLLAQAWRVPNDVAKRLAAVVGGHHGVFPRSREIQNLRDDEVGRGEWEASRERLMTTVAAALGLPRDSIPSHLDHPTAMALAGLVSVADWIGSNTTYFPYWVQDPAVIPSLDPHDYYARAEQRAIRALEELGWTGWTAPVAPASFQSLFPHLRAPRPLQEAVVALAERLTSPAIVVIEAPMGEGKTEAALYLTDRWGMQPGPRGAYVALPTQATSNQMFSRLRNFLATRYAGERVTVQLVHGHTALSAELQELLRLEKAGQPPFLPTAIHADGSGRSEESASVVAGEWFTYRKRGLLAPFGVGTIDQALLAVLQTRHVFVRLFGLAHKVVIVDEVHAYDTYMSMLLERLLEWLAALGSPVVLLSATLPRQRRDALVAAYRRGLGPEGRATLPDVPYPRIAWASATDIGAETISTSSQVTRRLLVEWIDGRLPSSDAEPFPLGERLHEALLAGGCAAVICNTVTRAQTVYRALRRYFPGDADDGLPVLDLFHARYRFRERDEREKRALLRFGKPGGTVSLGNGKVQRVRRPHRAVLVATQIIEQSLDLDFDVLVTDLAPIDLVLQRAGRLHRHARGARPVGLSAPRVLLCQPESEEKGVPRFESGTAAVYDAHILLRTWLALRGRQSIRVPDEVADLIEAVYADQSCPPEFVAQWGAAWEETMRARNEAVEAEKREAELRWLRGPRYDGQLWRYTEDPREEDAPDFHQAHQALTRLAPPTVQLVCLYGTLDAPAFDPARTEPVPNERQPGVAVVRRLLECAVPVAHRGVVPLLLAQRPPAGWQRSSLLRHCRLVVLDGAGRTTVGRYDLRLDDEVGLEIRMRGGE